MAKPKLIGRTIKNTRKELQHEIEGLLGKEEYKKFKEFAFKGDMIKMAIAFILGAAFNNAVRGITDFIVMPILNFILNQTNSDWRNYKFEFIQGLSLEVGKFAGVFVDFLLIAIVLYILYTKVLNPIFEEEELEIKCIETRPCSFCKSKVNWKAKRCPNCTSWLDKI